LKLYIVHNVEFNAELAPLHESNVPHSILAKPGLSKPMVTFSVRIRVGVRIKVRVKVLYWF